MKNLFDSIREHLPAPLAAVSDDTWFLLPNWVWIVLAAASGISFVLQPLMVLVFRRAKRLFRRRKDSADYGDKFIDHLTDLPIERALSWIFMALLWLALIDSLALEKNADRYLLILTKLLLAWNVIRLAYNIVAAVGRVFEVAARKTATTLDDQLVPFGTKAAKGLVIILGVLTTLQNFGVNVVSLLAGLGLGGLALALAAQDTVANLFGSLMILMDQPFKVGDWIKIGNNEGTVEEVGFRSTRIRTFYNSLITIPNSVVAKEQIDNMGMRRRRRVRQTLGIIYETPTAKIKEFTDRVRYLVLQEDKVDRNAVTVTFNNFNSSSLDILLQFHLLDIASAQEEQERTQNIFLEVINLAAEMGVEFAYPTQMSYQKNVPAKDISETTKPTPSTRPS